MIFTRLAWSVRQKFQLKMFVLPEVPLEPLPIEYMPMSSESRL